MILPLTLDKCLCEPFADYANITVAKADREALTIALQPLLEMYGCNQPYDGLYAVPGGFGTLKISDTPKVSCFSTSGQFLANLRAGGMLDQYLTLFSDFSHNVSMLHATVDYGVNAPLALQEIYSLSTSGNFHLSRKALNPNHVTKFMGLDIDGVETGTVNLGYRQNYDVWAKVYDKRHERLQKGFEDCGQMLRIEIALQTAVGATLRDISNPHDIFYQFASKSLVEAPKGFKGWVSHAGGLFIPAKEGTITTHEQLWWVIEKSEDFRRVIDLACRDYGEDALAEITKLIKKRISMRRKVDALGL